MNESEEYQMGSNQKVLNFVLFESKIVELVNGSNFDEILDLDDIEKQLLDEVCLVPAGIYLDGDNLRKQILLECHSVALNWNDPRWENYLKENCITALNAYTSGRL